MATRSIALSVASRSRRNQWWRPALFAFSVILLMASVALWVRSNHRAKEKLRPAHVEFFERVKQQGGSVFFDQDSNLLTKTSRWLRKRTGWGLPGIQANRYTGSLRLMGPEFTDADMPLLEDLVRLEELHLYATNVTDEGLRHLSGLKQLKHLVFDPQMSDAALRHLAGLHDLTTLDLINTQVHGEGLTHLAGLPRLKNLYLTSTPMDDGGMKEITAFESLEKLYLNYTQITDAGLVHLAGLNNLVFLSLSGTRISEAGLEHLTELSNLQQLELDGTQVSDAGISRVQQALSEVKISR